MNNSQDCSNHTTLHAAAYQGHTKIVKLLLAKEDIDVNSENIGRKTLLFVAVEQAHRGIVEMLFGREEIGMNPKKTDVQTRLFFAIRKNNIELVKLLLAKQGLDLDVNLKDHRARLTISNDVSQPATELCNSPVSLGPDYLNVAEGLFYQMSTKTLYSLCDETIKDHCLNKDLKKLVTGGIIPGDAGYTTILDWSDGPLRCIYER